jgi:hypothetical protein
MSTGTFAGLGRVSQEASLVARHVDPPRRHRRTIEDVLG